VQALSPILTGNSLAVKAVAGSVERMAASLLSFDGKFADLPRETAMGADLAAAFGDEVPQGAAADALNQALLRLLDVRDALVALQDITLLMQRVWFLAYHTPGANWDTVLQLLFREDHDAVVSEFEPNCVPIASWNDKVKAAMRRLGQDAGLTKDGTPLGPLCPGLRGSGAGFGRDVTNRSGSHSSGRSGKPAPSKNRFSRGGGQGGSGGQRHGTGAYRGRAGPAHKRDAGAKDSSHSSESGGKATLK
jgi:uncharacterized membrane protein YgcG